MPIERAALIEFMREQPWAVVATTTPKGPEAAVIGVVITDDLEIVFDSEVSSRKVQNLRRDPRVALVIGWDSGKTVQYEGIADEPSSSALDPLRARYLARFPDGVERAAKSDIAYVRVKPTWIRFSDFTGPTPVVDVIDPATFSAP